MLPAKETGRCLLTLFFVGLAGPALARGEGLSDDAIHRQIIAKSIAAYPSVCACPYSTMRNGRSCGGRSAHSRPGGHAPLCYPEDVPADMVRRLRMGR